jgi:hypothetical protein
MAEPTDAASLLQDRTTGVGVSTASWLQISNDAGPAGTFFYTAPEVRVPQGRDRVAQDGQVGAHTRAAD